MIEKYTINRLKKDLDTLEKKLGKLENLSIDKVKDHEAIIMPIYLAKLAGYYSKYFGINQDLINYNTKMKNG